MLGTEMSSCLFQPPLQRHMPRDVCLKFPARGYQWNVTVFQRQKCVVWNDVMRQLSRLSPQHVWMQILTKARIAAYSPILAAHKCIHAAAKEPAHQVFYAYHAACRWWNFAWSSLLNNEKKTTRKAYSLGRKQVNPTARVCPHMPQGDHRHDRSKVFTVGRVGALTLKPLLERS